MYVDELLSYREIGERLGVHPTSAHTKLKRETLRRGEAWPLRKEIRKSTWDTVSSAVIAGYVRELRARGIPYTEFARRAGTCVGVIYNLTSPHPRRDRILRSAADRYMETVEYFERQLKKRIAA